MAPVKANQASLTREAILGAAIRLFQQFGFSTLGMRQIADNLQIKAPSLYHHFASKEDLARQAMQLYREEQASRLNAISGSGSLTLAEHLRQYTELFAQMLEDGKRPCMYLMMVREPSFQERTCIEELQRFATQNIDWLEKILHSEPANLRLRQDGAERELAELIFASLEGIMAVSMVEKSPHLAFRRRAHNLLNVVLAS
ncbi:MULTISPECIES: TetR/AcrR family transcriptional regulator [unclassified Duganella]|uniref:TetR/AcrR family transcriptional regulator n=1 Tax=unclassified Duganella TaxID=2636909 RepID=UPI0007017A59|nr:MULTISPECIES: TetR/AcrR family transcriptional regulator [unclassified Duganella]KQV61510.1 TetR family transcriptional regulator [Duganella sp. Root336D2]KRB92398.1 TetR family transcriptional regulator [Duganella sp. Root198D2]